MSDNTTLNAMSGGDTYASDDIGGVKFPRVKLIYGPDGTNSGDVDPANPLPVRATGLLASVAYSGAPVSPANPLPMTATGLFVSIGASGAAIAPTNPLSTRLYGSGAVLDHTNPLAVSLPSGVNARVEAPSGIQVSLPSGVHIGGGTGAPITLANPLPVRVFTGMALGALASGLPVTPLNPFQVGLYGSGARIDHTNPMPVSIPSGVSVSISSVTVQGIDAHDAALTANPVTVGGFASAAAPSSVTDGDAARAWFLPNGAQVSALQAAGSLLAAGGGASANALRVTAASDSLPWPTTQATGGVLQNWARQATGTVFNVTQATGAPLNTFSQQATGTVHATTQATGSVHNAWVRQATGTVNLIGIPTGGFMLSKVESEEQHGAAPTGGPFLVGFQGRGSDPISVASGTVAQSYADTQGKQVVLLGAPISLRLRGMAGLQGTGSRSLIPAQGSGFSIAVTALSAMNASPTFASRVVLHDGSATLFGGFASAGGGGFTHNGGGIPLFVASPNTAIQAVNLATGAEIDVTVSGFKVSNP